MVHAVCVLRWRRRQQEALSSRGKKWAAWWGLDGPNRKEWIPDREEKGKKMRSTAGQNDLEMKLGKFPNARIAHRICKKDLEKGTKETSKKEERKGFEIKALFLIEINFRS
jgi:hypothetical protein